MLRPAQSRPRLIQVDAPVKANDLSTCIGHELQQRARSRAEVDAWDVWQTGRAQAVEELAHVRLNEARVLTRTERADPAIEDLDGLRARRDLPAREPQNNRGQ